jgi:MYXO-CTERM domain-containing protein
MRGLSVGLGVAAILVAATGPVYAGGVPVATPEIDPTSIVAGLGLLGAGLMVLRARRRSK